MTTKINNMTSTAARGAVLVVDTNIISTKESTLALPS